MAAAYSLAHLSPTPSPLHLSMWYELHNRVNYYTVDTHLVWAKTLEGLLPLMEHLKITACTTSRYTD